MNTQQITSLATITTLCLILTGCDQPKLKEYYPQIKQDFNTISSSSKFKSIYLDYENVEKNSNLNFAVFSAIDNKTTPYTLIAPFPNGVSNNMVTDETNIRDVNIYDSMSLKNEYVKELLTKIDESLKMWKTSNKSIIPFWEDKPKESAIEKTNGYIAYYEIHGNEQQSEKYSKFKYVFQYDGEAYLAYIEINSGKTFTYKYSPNTFTSKRVFKLEHIEDLANFKRLLEKSLKTK